MRSLNIGGAERQLETLIHGMDKTKYKMTVVCFYSGGKLQKNIEAAGVQVISLQKKSRWDLPVFFSQLITKIKELQPDVLYALLPVPNILSILLKLFIPGLKVIFGVRASGLVLSNYDWTFRFSIWLEAFFSRWADCLIVNSKAGKEYCLDRGISKKIIRVIPNGINSKTCKPDPEAGIQIRHEWRIPQTSLLIGIIGRVDPTKDYSTFLHACSKLVEKQRFVRFVCVGDGQPEYREKMIQMSKACGLTDHMIWSPARNDMPAVYNALNICCSSSIYEGFPNVIGEAMATGIPCVVTDVGDSADIVGDTGKVVPTGQPEVLAEALQQLIDLPEEDRQALGALARQRIEARYAVEKMVCETQKVFDQLMGMQRETN